MENCHNAINRYTAPIIPSCFFNSYNAFYNINVSVLYSTCSIVAFSCCILFISPINGSTVRFTSCFNISLVNYIISCYCNILQVFQFPSFSIAPFHVHSPPKLFAPATLSRWILSHSCSIRLTLMDTLLAISCLICSSVSLSLLFICSSKLFCSSIVWACSTLTLHNIDTSILSKNVLCILKYIFTLDKHTRNDIISTQPILEDNNDRSTYLPSVDKWSGCRRCMCDLINSALTNSLWHTAHCNEGDDGDKLVHTNIQIMV